MPVAVAALLHLDLREADGPATLHRWADDHDRPMSAVDTRYRSSAAARMLLQHLTLLHRFRWRPQHLFQQRVAALHDRNIGPTTLLSR